jgi:hypothetical protein
MQKGRAKPLRSESRKQNVEIEAGDRAKPGKADQIHTGPKAEGRRQNAEMAGKADQSHHRAKAESRKAGQRRPKAGTCEAQARYELVESVGI